MAGILQIFSLSLYNRSFSADRILVAAFNITSHNRATVACGISLSNAAHASQRPQSTTAPLGRRSQGRLTKSAVIAHAQQLPYDIHRVDY